MADITLTTTESNIVVDASNNIIQVSSTPTTVVVGEGSTVDNAQIRAALSNVAPILYDASTGVFSFDANATFSGKTTDDLPQGNSNIYFSTSGAAVNTTNLPEGANLYFTAARVRSNVSATSATGISYNSGTGVFSLGSIPNSSLSTSAITINGTSVSLGGSRTLSTADIAENTNLYFTAARARGNVSAVDAGGYGSFSYNSTSGAFTYTGPSDSDIRGRISSLNTGTGFGNVTYDSGTGVISYERVTQSQVRNSFSVTDTGGDGSLTYNSGTGVITYTGPSASEVRAHLSATNSGSGFGNLAYDNSTGVTTYTRVSNANIASSILNNTIKLKDFSETAIDYGNTAGNISIDLSTGTIHEYTLVGNVTYISFANAVAGSSATLIFKQDIVGGRQLDTTTHSWAGWEFAGNSKTLTLPANSIDVMTVIIPATNEYYASIVSMEGSAIPNSGLANSNVIINGVTIALGSQGNIDTFNSNVTVNGNLNVAGNLNYQNVTDLYVTDQKITLNSNAATNSNVEIISNRPTATSTSLKWNEQATRWEFTNDGTTYYPIPTSTTDLAEGANLYYTTGRANTAIDNRVTKTFVEGLGVSYTSLTDKPTIPTHTSNLTNDSGFITTANANVISVNGKTGTVTLSTTDIAEGSNLYFTTDRANNAIAAYQGPISTPGNIATTGNINAGYYFGNGAFLTGITGSGGGNVSLINTGENLTGGPITTTGTIGMATALANVNSISTQSGQDLVLTSEDPVRIRARHRNGTLADSANIAGEGYALTAGGALYDAPFVSYTGTGELKTLAFDGTITAGSNVITGVANVHDLQGNSLTIGNVAAYYIFTDQPLIASSTLFPAGTYVTSVSGSNIYMSANALYSETLAYDSGDPYASLGALTPGMRDNTTGLSIALESDFDDGGANVKLITFNFMTDTKPYYGYGDGGPVTTDFVYSIGTASDYSFNTNILNQFLVGRTNFSSKNTVGNFRRGLTVGNADLTNRGENDGLQTFGLNIVWDGTANTLTDYGTNALFPQILLKQYTDGTNQGPTGSGGLTTSGPRMLFLGAYGNATQDPYTTYARSTQELGKISWTSTTSFLTSPSTTGPAAYISVVSLKDQTTGPGDVGMYLVASPTAGGTSTNQVGGSTARSLWAGSHQGNTLISAGARTNGTSGDIYFAPARQRSNGGNAMQMAEQVINTGVGAAHWARVGYDNPSANTGGRVFVTNGYNASGARNGNLTLGINRNDNGVGFGSKYWALKLQPSSNDLVLTEDDVVRTTFSGANITTSGNISAGNTIVNGIAFNTTSNIAPTSGQIRYNVDYGTHQVGLDGSNVMLMGQDLVVYARNDEANTLVKGEVVYIAGASGDKATIKRAVNNSDANSATTIGIVKSDIAVGQLGYVVSQGVVDGLNLTGYASGDKVYLGNVAGTFTNVKPSSPEHYVFIGVVEKANAGSGQILVRVQNGFELDEIHDVNVNNVQPNDILFRNSGNTLWVNQNFGTTVTNSNITLKQFQETRVDLGSTGGNITLDMANGSVFAMTATSSISNIALSNAGIGASGTLIITQDGSGSKTLTTTSAWKFANGSKTLTTTAGAIDIISFFTDGTTVYAALSKGYS